MILYKLFYELIFFNNLNL